MSTPDPGLLVTVFDSVPGGYLPVGEFGDLCAELDRQRQRVQHLAELIERQRIQWFLIGAAIGAALVIVVDRLVT